MSFKKVHSGQRKKWFIFGKSLIFLKLEDNLFPFVKSNTRVRCLDSDSAQFITSIYLLISVSIYMLSSQI